MVLKKKFVMPIESWFFTFFYFFWLMVLHDVIFNVSATIWIWSFWFFSRNLTRSLVLKFWVKTHINKKNFNSLIITNMDLRYEPCVLNLVWKWWTKDPKKRKDHLSKEVHTKKHAKKKKLWCLNIIISYIPWNGEL
jgi:hypothetical protein